MIKHKGNIKSAIKEIKKISNATSHIFQDAQNQTGSLGEMTFTLKSNFALKNHPSSGSSKILENFVAGYDATVYQKLKNEGAALIAQTHADELGLGGTGLNSSFGEIFNPHDQTRMVGGSSGGAAATLIDGVTLTVGSDTGDSIRTPASYVGKVGFKPSYGAISRYGMYAFATSLDTVGFMAHNVNDIIVASQVAYGKDGNDMTSRDVDLPEVKQVKPKKIAIIKNYLAGYEKPYQDEFNKLIDKLKADSVEIIEHNINDKYLELISIIYQIISFSEASSNLANLDGINFGKRLPGDNYSEIMTNTRSHKFGSLLQRRLTLGAYFLSAKHQVDLFERAQKVRRLIAEEFNKIYGASDYILSIATTIAPLVSEGKPDTPQDNFLIHSNFEGSPSIVLPFSKYKDMPFGIALDTKQDNDKSLLSTALYLEEVVGGIHE